MLSHVRVSSQLMRKQSIMALSTVKFHDVENGGQYKDENGVMPSDDPTDDEWDDIGWD